MNGWQFWDAIGTIFTGVLVLVYAFYDFPFILKKQGIDAKAKKRERNLWKIFGVVLIISGAMMLFYKGSAGKPVKNDIDVKLPSPQIIKEQAGEPDASGWVPAYSTRGGFFVYLPAPFKEIEIPQAEIGGEQVTVFGVETNFEGINLNAQFYKNQNIFINIEACKSGIIHSFKSFKYNKRISETSFAGKYPLIEQEIETPEVEKINQVIITRQGVYLLTVEYKKASEQNLAIAKRFFDSFKIIGPSDTRVKE